MEFLHNCPKTAEADVVEYIIDLAWIFKMFYCLPQQSNSRLPCWLVGGGSRKEFIQISLCFPDKLKEREEKIKSTMLSWHCRKGSQKQI